MAPHQRKRVLLAPDEGHQQWTHDAGLAAAIVEVQRQSQRCDEGRVEHVRVALAALVSSHEQVAVLGPVQRHGRVVDALVVVVIGVGHPDDVTRAPGHGCRRGAGRHRERALDPLVVARHRRLHGRATLHHHVHRAGRGDLEVERVRDRPVADVDDRRGLELGIRHVALRIEIVTARELIVGVRRVVTGDLGVALVVRGRRDAAREARGRGRLGRRAVDLGVGPGRIVDRAHGQRVAEAPGGYERGEHERGREGTY